MQLLQELSLKNGPLCVGLDTDPSYIPENILAKYESPAQAVLAYNKAIIDRVVADKSACCFKVQIAYYEAMGLEGMKVYAETLKYVRASGLIAISDIKRGDIGATSDAYAKAHFTGDFETDIITINPYMGFDTLKLSEGGLLLERVGAEIERIGEEFRYSCADYNDQTCGIFGAVVGATQEVDARWLRDKYKDTFFLIPGYGAQGGDAEICKTLLERAGGTVNSSRGILCAWKKDAVLAEKTAAGTLTMDDIAGAAAKAAVDSKIDLTR